MVVTSNLHTKFDTMGLFAIGSQNIGIAMATPYGLVVPSIKNVQSLSILEVSLQSYDCLCTCKLLVVLYSSIHILIEVHVHCRC